MKNEKSQTKQEKRSLEDFEHRITVQLKENHYIDYALSHSKEQIQKGKKRAVLWAVLFTVLGLIALYKGSVSGSKWSDIYLTMGVLFIVFQIFNLFYNFVMFPIALKRSILKELKKDPSLLAPMEYAFEPDKIVCFLEGKHRNTILTEDIFGVEETQDTMILQIKSGRRVIFPKETLRGADPVIVQQIDSLRKQG